MTTIIKGNKITIEAKVNPGLNETVKEFKWHLDNNQIVNDSYTYILDTSLLSIGIHIIKFEAQNNCGNKGTSIIEINIMEESKMDINIKVDKPIVEIPVTFSLKGTVKATIKDQLNNPIVKVPIILKDISGTPLSTVETDTEGIALIIDVLYGDYILSVG